MLFDTYFHVFFSETNWPTELDWTEQNACNTTTNYWTHYIPLAFIKYYWLYISIIMHISLSKQLNLCYTSVLPMVHIWHQLKTFIMWTLEDCTCSLHVESSKGSIAWYEWNTQKLPSLSIHFLYAILAPLLLFLVNLENNCLCGIWKKKNTSSSPSPWYYLLLWSRE